MRTTIFALLLFGFGLSSCQRQSQRPTAHEAGRDAYKATQDLKKGVKNAARDLRNAGQQFREGWNQEKHEDNTAPKRDERDRSSH